MSPLISVIVPVYKTQAYLNQCVESILNQTFSDFELILVDDGSPDFCPNMCDEYEILDNRVHVIHKKNGGLQSAIRAAIDAATGEYLCFVDSDDWIEMNMLTILSDSIRVIRCDIVVYGFIWEHENKRVLSSGSSASSGIYYNDQIKSKILPTLLYNRGMSKVSINSSRCNKLIRRSIVLENIKYYFENITTGEDFLLVFPCILSSSIICLLESQYLYHYRIREGSITHTFDQTLFKQFEQRMDMINTIAADKDIKGLDDQIDNMLMYFAFYTLQNLRTRLFIDKKRKLIGYIREIVKSVNIKVPHNIETSNFTEKFFSILIRCRAVTIIYLSCYIQELISILRSKLNYAKR